MNTKEAIALLPESIWKLKHGQVVMILYYDKDFNLVYVLNQETNEEHTLYPDHFDGATLITV